MAETTPLINEPSSAGLSSGLSATRGVIAAVGGFAIGRGWLDESTLNAILALVATVGPIAYGAWSTYWRTRAIKEAASMVPDRIINSKA